MIQKTAELILQGFYTRKINTGGITDGFINFELDDKKWVLNSDDDTLLEAILQSAQSSVVTVKNALQFLYEEKLIDYKFYGVMSGEISLYNLDITSKGVKMIEGVTKTPEGKARYENTFNVKINLAENINVESFVKGELGSLFSLFNS